MCDCLCVEVVANLEFRDKLVSSKSPDNLRMAEKLSNRPNSRYIDDIGVCNINNINDCMMF